MQTYGIVEEMIELEYLTETEQRKIPIPKFFYIQKYGRTLEEQMKEILPRIRKKNWFLFKTDGVFREGNLFQNLALELEKHASIGKDYRECVVIEFTEDVLHKEGFTELLEFLAYQQNEFEFIFTMKKAKNTATIQERLEQYFFVRKIEAVSYTPEEQIGIIKEICAEYEVTLGPSSEEILRKGLENMEWKEADSVRRRLENGVYRVIYEHALTATTSELQNAAEVAYQILGNIEKKKVNKHAIGFCQGGYSYE